MQTHKLNNLKTALKDEYLEMRKLAGSKKSGKDILIACDMERSTQERHLLGIAVSR